MIFKLLRYSELDWMVAEASSVAEMMEPRPLPVPSHAAQMGSKVRKADWCGQFVLAVPT